MRNVIMSMLAAALLGSTAYVSAKGEEAPKIPVAENAIPDGKVTLKGGSVAAGIGYSWGHGDLDYHAGTHRFTIKGVSIAEVGADKYTATGHVYNLKNLSDFSGNYVAAAAGIAVAGGGTATYLKNEHGVVIKLLATDIGLKFDLAAEGVHISLKK